MRISSQTLRRGLTPGLIVAAIAVLLTIMSITQNRDGLDFIQAVASGIQMGLMYSLIAVGVTIIWGLMEQINFAHGDLMMVGMFMAFWLAKLFGIDPLITIAIAAVVMFFVGILIYKWLMSRVLRAELWVMALVTFGLLLFLQNTGVAAFTADYRYINISVLNSISDGGFHVGGIAFGVPQLAGGIVALLVFIGLYWFIEKTEVGMALQATSEDRDAAALVGVKADRMFALGWGIGTSLAAVSGVLLANFFAIFATIGFPFGILAYAIVALGGFGSVLGTLVAALLVGVVQSLTALYTIPALKDSFVMASYLIISLFRPQGLFGRF